MGEILYGTSSWSAKGWVGPFYPPGTKPGEMLGLYATRFSVVEADVTYYRLPDARLVQGWAAKTPPGFRLAAKFPRSIVHAGDGPRPDASRVLLWDRVGPDTEAFVEVMSLLGDKLGPLLLQLPYFNRDAFSSAGPFLERLDAFLTHLPEGPRIAVEIRNKAWVTEPFLDLLRKHDAAFTLVDLAYMPHPADLAKRHDLLTTDFTYARLIGDRKATEALTRTFDSVVLDQGHRLDRWAELLAAMHSRIERAYVFANNHYAGHGPQTVEDLRERVEAVMSAGEG